MANDTLRESDDTEELQVIEDQESGEHVEVETQSDERQYAQSDDDYSEAEREVIRERRRIEKRERKQRQDAAKNRDKTELTFLQRRNEELERRFSSIEGKMMRSELSEYDTAIAQASQRAQLAEQVFAKAISAKNGEDASKAMQYRDQAKAAVYALEQRKAQEVLRIQQAQYAQQQKQNEIPPRQVEMAQDFIREHDWYDPAGSDEDSAIVLAIDAALVKAGVDPNTDEYWDELREKVKRRLPEKFNKREQRSDTNRPRGGPQIGSGRNDSAPSGRREVYISPERKNAMIEAGVWDDAVLRQKYIKRYMDYDKQNSR
jgi:hypothetical protein